MPIRLLIFDLDGTLVDSFRDIVTSCNLLLGTLDAGPLADDQIRPCIGRGVRYLVECVLRQGGVEVGDAGALVSRYRDIYRAHALDETRLYTGVRETLTALSETGATLAVLSNKPEDACRGMLAYFGIDRLFSRVAGGDSYSEMKPSPLPLHRIGEELARSSSETVMVGDSVYDIETGKRAGVVTVAALYGFQSPEMLKALEPDFSVSAFSEILELPFIATTGR
ncbi:MAG: HAD-IA family hydrolase [Bacteroidetes bacterium]|nr:HAD-IA family hydrolase [Bacteroidota bacterium]